MATEKESPAATPAAAAPVATSSAVEPKAEALPLYEYKQDPQTEFVIKNRQMIADRYLALTTAYDAMKKYYDTQPDGSTLKMYFAFGPTARADIPLKKSLTHGLVVTNPNVPDHILPDKALTAREDFVNVGINAVKAAGLPVYDEPLQKGGSDPMDFIKRILASRSGPRQPAEGQTR